MSPDPVIRIDGLTVRYGRKTAVDNVTLSVPRGAVYALLGRNGAGKSSLVRCLLGQQKPAAGAIEIFGDDAWTQRQALMERVGVVSEEADAPPDMSVAALSRFCARVYARWDQRIADARLECFGIAPAARFGELSKGQKKEVALALATAMSPDLLILDDPTLGLDVVARKALFEEVIGELADRGITVFVTTHDLGGIEALADRVGILRGGALVVDDELETLKSRFRRIRYPSTLTRAVVANYDAGAVETFADAEVAPMSLEEIFIAVAGEGAEK